MKEEEYVVLGLLGLGLLASKPKVQPIQRKTEAEIQKEVEERKEIEPTTGYEVVKVAEGVSYSGEIVSVSTPEEKEEVEKSTPPSETPLPALKLEYTQTSLAEGVVEYQVRYPVEVEVWIPSINIDRLRQIHSELLNLYNIAKTMDLKHQIGRASSMLGYLQTFWREDFNGFVSPENVDMNVVYDSLNSAINLAKTYQPDIVDELESIYTELKGLSFTKKKMWTYTL